MIVPGVAKHDLHVTSEPGRLVVTGVRRPPVAFGDAGYREFGMAYGPIHQHIDLPPGLALDRMHLSLHHGVLDIHLPFLDPHMAEQWVPAGLLPPAAHVGMIPLAA